MEMLDSWDLASDHTEEDYVISSCIVNKTLKLFATILGMVRWRS